MEDEEKKRISDLPVLYPSDYEDFVMLGNQSDITGVMSSTDMVTNYLENIIDGNRDFDGLNSYIHAHGGGDFEHQYNSFFYRQYEITDYSEVTNYDWQVLVHKSHGSYYTVWMNSFIHAHVEKYISDIPEDYYGHDSYHQWLFFSYNDGNPDTTPVTRVWANSYLRDYVDKYLHDRPHEAPQYIDDTDRVLLYGIDPDEDNTWANYITLSELAEYIKNYTPPT